MTDKAVRVRGADRVARTMKAAAHDLATMDTATAEYGRRVVTAAQDFAPVRTGRLRASIALHGTQVKATTEYAQAVEFGSRRRGIRPVLFMTRAAETTERDADKIYTAGADKITDQIKGA